MNLKELKKMIKEEWENFNEQAPANATPTLPTVNVSDNDVDVTGGDEDAEETLRDIFEMLKAYFEGGAEKDDTDTKDTADADDAEDADNDEAPKDAALQERFKKLANIIKG